jgi:hypothetical protein
MQGAVDRGFSSYQAIEAILIGLEEERSSVAHLLG